MKQASPWRPLAFFWAAILLLGTAGAITLQVLGPPNHASTPHAPPSHAPTSHAAAPKAADTHTDTHAPAAAHPTEPTPSPRGIAQPDPALLERSRVFPTAQLPRLGPDGRAARTAYAAPYQPPPAGTPRIALLLSGFGQAERESRSAIETLPGPVAFAVSAYAGAPPALFDAAREAGHELLASIPMEPAGYPLNDEGTRSLRTGLSPEDNRTNLEWSLSRTLGAVGATGASDGMRGERFAELAGAFDPILDEIARRGLLYIDARPGRTTARPGLPARTVDLVLDDPPARAEIEAKLATLERIAREKGSALGLAGPLRPVTIERIAAWAQGLQAKGIVLVPVSALAETPK